MTLDLNDEEREALIRYLRDGIDGDRFPLSQRLTPIRAILAKLEPAARFLAPPGHSETVESTLFRVASPAAVLAELRHAAAASPADLA